MEKFLEVNIEFNEFKLESRKRIIFVIWPNHVNCLKSPFISAFAVCKCRIIEHKKIFQ